MKLAPVGRAEIAAARKFAIKTLDRYDFSLEVITGVLGLSARTVQRAYPRLPNRAPSNPDVKELVKAAQLIVVLASRAGYPVKLITRLLGASPAFVYRTLNQVDDLLGRHDQQLHRRIAAAQFRPAPMVLRTWASSRGSGSTDPQDLVDPSNQLDTEEYA